MSAHRDDLACVEALWPVAQLAADRELCDDRDRLAAVAEAAIDMSSGVDDATVRRMARAVAALEDPRLRLALAHALASLDEALERVLELTAPGTRGAGWGRRLLTALEDPDD